MSGRPAIIDIHTPTSSFSIAHSVQDDSLQILFDRLGAKANNGLNGRRVEPGMVKYGWQDGPVFNLDDDADYAILLWKASSDTDNSHFLPPTLYLHDPSVPLPSSGAYRNSSYYTFRSSAGNSLAPPGGGAKSIRSNRSKRSKGSRRGEDDEDDGIPVHKKEFARFHGENGVRTIYGKIGPVDNVRMLLKNGYRHVYLSRSFAKSHGFIPRDAQPGLYGFNGLVQIGKWPVTVGSTTTTHDVYLSEETHFDVVLGRSFMERRAVTFDKMDLTKVVCMDTGEHVECEVVVIRDGRGDVVTVT